MLLASNLEQLAFQFEDAVDYIEHMLQQQLIAAIGKEVRQKDFEEFIQFYYPHKLYAPQYAPKPLCFAIRRPGYYQDGILSIEVTSKDSAAIPYLLNKEGSLPQPIETFTRMIPAGLRDGLYASALRSVFATRDDDRD